MTIDYKSGKGGGVHQKVTNDDKSGKGVGPLKKKLISIEHFFFVFVLTASLFF